MPDITDVGDAFVDGYAGGESFFYYNKGSFDTPTWTEVTNHDDLDIPDSRTKIAAPIRKQYPFIGYLPGARDIGLTWGSLVTKGTQDTVTADMVAAYDSGGVVEFAIADGPIDQSGTKYRRIGAIINKADEGLPLGDKVMWSFEACFALRSPTTPSRQVVS